MSLDEARRQHLFRRMVMVLMYDQHAKLYLKKQGGHGASAPYRWDIGLVTYLRPGESTECGAHRKIREGLGRITGRLRCIDTSSPFATTERVFASLYKLNTCDTVLQHDDGTTLAVDQDEISGLVTHCPELLTERVVSLWKQRDLFDVL